MGKKEEMTVRQYIKDGNPIRAVYAWFGPVWDESHGEMWEALLMQEIRAVIEDNVYI